LGNSATIDAIEKTVPRLAAPFHARSLKKTDRSFEKDKQFRETQAMIVRNKILEEYNIP
jgi:hypothetical protein